MNRHQLQRALITIPAIVATTFIALHTHPSQARAMKNAIAVSRGIVRLADAWRLAQRRGVPVSPSLPYDQHTTDFLARHPSQTTFYALERTFLRMGSADLKQFAEELSVEWPLPDDTLSRIPRIPGATELLRRTNNTDPAKNAEILSLVLQIVRDDINVTMEEGAAIDSNSENAIRELLATISRKLPLLDRPGRDILGIEYQELVHLMTVVDVVQVAPWINTDALSSVVRPRLPSGPAYEVEEWLVDGHSNIMGFFSDGGTDTVIIDGSKTRYVRWRQTGEATLINEADAKSDFLAFCKRQLATFSVGNVKAFTVSPPEPSGHIRLVFSDEDVLLSTSDLEQLEAQSPLPADHRLTVMLKNSERPFILWSHPLMLRPGDARTHADDLLFALREGYPQAHIYRDPMTEKTAARATELGAFYIKSGRVIGAVIPGESFTDVKDYRVMQNLKDQLGTVKIKLYDVDEPADRSNAIAEKKAIIVLTGHANEEFHRFINIVGKADVLRDRYVLLNSCQTEASRRLINEINERHGAKAVFSFKGVVDASDLEPFILNLVNYLKTHEGGNLELILDDALEKSGLSGVWTISRVTESPMPYQFMEHAHA